MFYGDPTLDLSQRAEKRFYGDPNYLGSAPLEDMTEHNFSAAGLSGRNTEFLLELAEFY